MRAAVSLPRLVVVTRKSALTQLRARHGTTGQAKFYLASRKQKLDTYEDGDARLEAGLATVLSALPSERRRARVDRDELDRFVFEPEDIVFVVGQDGLVANVAKYLDKQPVIGINPDPSRFDGVLCRIPPGSAAAALAWFEADKLGLVSAGPRAAFAEERRTMALVEREDGQRLRALNEVFIGHRTHQSARYLLTTNGKSEHQSSSGIICATGTGATGWARSIAVQRGLVERLPTPTAASLTWFVREPFPSVSTGTTLDVGAVTRDDVLTVVSEMGEDGVIFADGIEGDRLEFSSGQIAKVRVDSGVLRLIVPSRPGGRSQATRLIHDTSADT
ncbi:MAG: hypothetical protein Q8P18_21125 [Pseudomonadota bacterium]|nr:hypothetical protein [Pseudomonadota bacterium]